MSYNHNEYNYQIAVIFAILIGGCLLLAGVVGGIYFMCVNTMRDEDKKRLQPGRNPTGSWAPQTPVYHQQPGYRDRPPSVTAYNPAAAAGPQSYEFGDPRSPGLAQNASSYTPVPSTYNPQQYSQVPLGTPVTRDYVVGGNMPQLQPDVIFTQGPSGYVQQRPVEYTVQQSGPGFHQSSV